MSEVDRLERWYAAQCDGEWEHEFGIRIDSLDNPGWWVIIDLQGTALESRAFVPVDMAREGEWLSCKVEDGQFHGAGCPGMLERIIREFCDWAEAPDRP